MKKVPNFKPQTYKLNMKSGINFIEIEGQKLPPPSKRITLDQKNIRVLNVKIVGKTKKGDIEFEVSRINHIKSFAEIRLHTKNTLYPGSYVIILEYKGELDESELGERIS